VNPLVWFSYFT